MQGNTPPNNWNNELFEDTLSATGLSTSAPSHQDLLKILGSLKDFFIAGMSFCEALRAAQPGDNKALTLFLLKIIPILYQRGLTLPSSSQAFGSYYNESLGNDIVHPQVTELEYTQLRNKLELVFGNDDYFLETMSEEMQFTDAPITARISECLADVYQPVQNLIESVRTSYDDISFDEIIATGEGFQTYWGDRLLATLRALHLLYYPKNNYPNDLYDDAYTDNNSEDDLIEREQALQQRVNDQIEELLAQWSNMDEFDEQNEE